MSAIATLLTVEKFLELPEKDGVRRELDEGMVIEMGVGGPVHERVKWNVTTLLARRTSRGVVFSESTYRLGPATAYMPDVGWLSPDRVARELPRLLEGAPDLAIEAVSSEAAAYLEKKVKAYFRNGARAVWAAFPDERVVRVYRFDGSSYLLTGDEVLREPELLPEFQAKVSEFFEGV